MRKIKKFKLFLFLLLILENIFAQQEGWISDITSSAYFFNPAYFGILGGWEGIISVKKQWISIPGSPQILGIAGYHTSKKYRITGGLMATTETIGPFSNSLISISGGYVLKAGTFTNIALSLRVGYSSYKFKSEELNIKDMGENTIKNINFNYPEISSGFVIQNRSFIGGISVSKINKVKFYEGPLWGSFKTRRHIYVWGSYSFLLSSQLMYRTSGILKYVNGAPPELQVNNYFDIYRSIEAGIGFRSIPSLVFIMGANIKNNIRTGFHIDVIFGRYRKGLITYEFNIAITTTLRKPFIHAPKVL